MAIRDGTEVLLPVRSVTGRLGSGRPVQLTLAGTPV